MSNLLSLFPDPEEGARIVAACTSAPTAPPTLDSLPPQDYLDATVVPILLQGLEALSKAKTDEDESKRPSDALEYLAHFLLANNPQRDPPSPPPPAPATE